MNNIGFGILCFGDSHYLGEAREKEIKILHEGFNCYILTDNPQYSLDHYILYDREIKSYHDKMILPKHILPFNDICILIDADTHITDYSFLEDLKTYKFKKGISYIDTLYNHPEKKRNARELNFTRPEWHEYEKYVSSILPTFKDHELIWEYFLVINPGNEIASNLRKFYEIYERLQIVKEFCDIRAKKNILGNGEGVSISIAAELVGIVCERDMELYKMIGHKMENMSRKYIV